MDKTVILNYIKRHLGTSPRQTAEVARRTILLMMTLLAITATASTKMKYPGGRQYVWRLTLTDKHESHYQLERPQRWLSAQAVERRRRQGLALDSTDLPVSPHYLKLLRQHKGISVVGQSRWMNTVLVRMKDTTIVDSLRRIGFVCRAEHVWTSPDSIERQPDYRYYERFQAWDSVKGQLYGGGREQIETVSGHRLHAIGLRGKGMTIAVLDGGFQNADRIPALRKANIEGTHDFVRQVCGGMALSLPPEQSVFRQIDHGTKVLSAMATNEPEVLVGTAPEAHFWLLRCEDTVTEQPVEEDLWVMAAELADSAGVDIINSSLGYNEYDKPHESYRLGALDGQTAFISRAASLLAGKGIVLVNSAGNNGMGQWKKINVPADADNILTVGALDRHGRLAPFSSVGNTQDGRTKPDVVALGSPAVLIGGRGTVNREMGTSFSTPVVCGLVACLWQAMRQKTATEIIELVRRCGSQHDRPDNVYGYGTPNFWRAYMIGKME